MPVNPHKLELLWQRLEDAKHESDLAHKRSILFREDKSAIPMPDGHYAHRQALQDEQQAISRYLSALQDFQAALASPTGVDISPRERQVLALIAAGKTSKEIAAHLGISLSTAVCHRYRIQTKLKAHNTADLTRAALRMGLIEL